ncbi:metal-binding protein [Reticulibacter mediterranei]|uniref:Metal-binding protein n=1 Tax=Reticulibacter mediterranei TaxID=2778369 RepID=A0A8J3N5R0_9CHLR|nr:cupredoxin domain-containing protein [Reticulibacter mediterranei]GHO99354.1 metal-binding protein [Reticulibacter mediterranei]
MSTVLSLSFRHLRWLWCVLALTTAVLLSLAACVGGTHTTPAGAAPAQTVSTVKIVEVNDKYMFDPTTLTIKKGSQVLWTNMSDASHTVTSNTGAFQTHGTLAEKQTFRFTFTTAGAFMYHCTVHPYMKATIIVTS